MPDWTKTNFRRLRSQSPHEAPMQWKLARDALRSLELGVSRFTRLGIASAGLVLSIGVLEASPLTAQRSRTMRPNALR